MSGKCGAHGGEEKHILGFGVETRRIEPKPKTWA